MHDQPAAGVVCAVAEPSGPIAEAANVFLREGRAVVPWLLGVCAVVQGTPSQIDALHRILAARFERDSGPEREPAAPGQDLSVLLTQIGFDRGLATASLALVTWTSDAVCAAWTPDAAVFVVHEAQLFSAQSLGGSRETEPHDQVVRIETTPGDRIVLASKSVVRHVGPHELLPSVVPGEQSRPVQDAAAWVASLAASRSGTRAVVSILDLPGLHPQTPSPDTLEARGRSRTLRMPALAGLVAVAAILAALAATLVHAATTGKPSPSTATAGGVASLPTPANLNPIPQVLAHASSTARVVSRAGRNATLAFCWRSSRPPKRVDLYLLGSGARVHRVESPPGTRVTACIRQQVSSGVTYRWQIGLRGPGSAELYLPWRRVHVRRTPRTSTVKRGVAGSSPAAPQAQSQVTYQGPATAPVLPATAPPVAIPTVPIAPIQPVPAAPVQHVASAPVRVIPTNPPRAVLPPRVQPTAVPVPQMPIPPTPPPAPQPTVQPAPQPQPTAAPPVQPTVPVLGCSTPPNCS